MEKLVILTKTISTCEIPMCAHCQFGKSYKRKKSNNNLIKDNIKHSGDLIYMDQAVSIIPGRWLT